MTFGGSCGWLSCCRRKNCSCSLILGFAGPFGAFSVSCADCWTMKAAYSGSSQHETRRVPAMTVVSLSIKNPRDSGIFSFRNIHSLFGVVLYWSLLHLLLLLFSFHKLIKFLSHLCWLKRHKPPLRQTKVLPRKFTWKVVDRKQKSRADELTFGCVWRRQFHILSDSSQ